MRISGASYPKAHPSTEREVRPVVGAMPAEQETPQQYHHRKQAEAMASFKEGALGADLSAYRTQRGETQISGSRGHHVAEGIVIAPPEARSALSKGAFPVTPFGKQLIETLNESYRDSRQELSAWERAVDIVKKFVVGDPESTIPRAKRVGSMTAEAFGERREGEGGGSPETELHISSGVRLSSAGAELLQKRIANGASLKELSSIIEIHRASPSSSVAGEWVGAMGWVPATVAWHLERLPTTQISTLATIAALRSRILTAEETHRFERTENWHTY